MEEINQTKEGFIKSMILFVVLLGICFAPFFAFSQIQEPAHENQIFINSSSGFSSLEKPQMNKKKIYSLEEYNKVEEGTTKTAGKH